MVYILKEGEHYDALIEQELPSKEKTRNKGSPLNTLKRVIAQDVPREVDGREQEDENAEECVEVVMEYMMDKEKTLPGKKTDNSEVCPACCKK